MREVLEKLYFTKVEFILKARGEIVLPEFKENLFRGAIGKVFKRLFCVIKTIPDCSECLLKDKCVYSRIFESVNNNSNIILKKVEKFPHPFVLYFPDRMKYMYKDGEKLGLEIVLIGDSIEYLPFFILVFIEMGKNGIGRDKIKFELKDVLSNGVSIYDSNEKRVFKEKINIHKGIDFVEKINSDTLSIEIKTPMKIQYAGKIQYKPDFHMIISNLLRRIQVLTALYCNGPDYVDFKDLLEKSKEIKIVYNLLKWEMQSRYSYRQRQVIGYDGIKGDIELSGDISTFYPFLKIAEFLHIGKGTTFGLGKIKIKK